MSYSVQEIKEILEETGEGDCQECGKSLASLPDEHVILEEGMCKFCYYELLMRA